MIISPQRRGDAEVNFRSVRIGVPQFVQIPLECVFKQRDIVDELQWLIELENFLGQITPCCEPKCRSRAGNVKAGAYQDHGKNSSKTHEATAGCWLLIHAGSLGCREVTGKKKKVADRTFLVSRVFRSGIQAVLPAAFNFTRFGCLSIDATLSLD